MIICDENLLKSGYKEFPKPDWGPEFADRFYQKCFKDEKGTKYFIDVYTYYDETSGLTDYEFRLTSESLANDKPCFCNVNLYGLPYEMLITDVETKIEVLWNALGGIYYEKIGTDR